MSNNKSLRSHNLVKLGLTSQESLVYLALMNSEELTIKDLSRKLNLLPQAVYRTVKNLENKKMVAVLALSPIKIQAFSPGLALPVLVKEKTMKMEKIAAETVNQLVSKIAHSSDIQVNIIYGQNAIYAAAARMIEYTKKELLIISIGESIPPDLLLANKRATERGVEIKMIVYKNDSENRQILDNFKKNGYKIKYYPNWGFHMAIYDSREALLIVNNPQETQQRVAMQLSSAGLSTALRDYFYSIWKKASVL